MTVGGKFSLSGLSWPLNSPYVTGWLAASLGLALLVGVGVSLGLRRTWLPGGDDCVCLPLRDGGVCGARRGDEA